MNKQSPDEPGAMFRRPRDAMMLSAFVYPGTGQLMQRRWTSAILFLASFTVVLLVFLIRAWQVISVYYSFAIHFFDMPDAPVFPSLRALLTPFLISMALYIANVVDVWLASRRPRLPPPIPPM